MLRPADIHLRSIRFADICSKLAQVSPMIDSTTVASETLEGMFLVNNSLNTQCRLLKPSAMDFY